MIPAASPQLHFARFPPLSIEQSRSALAGNRLILGESEWRSSSSASPRTSASRTASAALDHDGEHAAVAAGSIVTRNVPNRSLVMGNPARVVREGLEGFDPESEEPIGSSPGART